MTPFLLTCFASTTLSAVPPVELGRVAWQRGFDNARSQAAERELPLLVLFQEVPGCSTCTTYGSQVLSHPLIVEAAETLFMPVAVYNNIPGADQTTLKSFSEPEWNNPVVRIIDAERTALSPRLAGDYTVGGLARAMVTALQTAQRPVPTYLATLAEEGAGHRKLSQATFAMHCFWEGEVKLGAVPGVIATRPGFVDTLEVVQVSFDPTVVDYAGLLSRARALQCASRVFTHDDDQARQAGSAAAPYPGAMRADGQPKYYIGRTALRYVPMTELQANRVNAALSIGQSGHDPLSPRQLELLAAITAAPDKPWPVAIGAPDLPAAWAAAQAVAGRTAP